MAAGTPLSPSPIPCRKLYSSLKQVFSPYQGFLMRQVGRHSACSSSTLLLAPRVCNPRPYSSTMFGIDMRSFASGMNLAVSFSGS